MTEAAKPAAADRVAPANVTESGTAVVVVGPSGAGKDSVMTFAAQHFAGNGRIVFARRVITRPADAGGEAHIGVDEDTFSRMKREKAFCVSWEAHGLSYGVPREMLDAVGQGNVVIVNGSRQALPAFAATFPRLKIVTITAHAEVRAERLAMRGRESAASITARLERQAGGANLELYTVTIDNSGPLEIAGNALVRLLNAAFD